MATLPGSGGAIVALAAPLGPMALHLPYAVAALGALGMITYSARQLRIS